MDEAITVSEEGGGERWREEGEVKGEGKVEGKGGGRYSLNVCIASRTSSIVEPHYETIFSD